MFERIFGFISGRVDVTAEGADPELFMTECLRRQIPLLRPRRCGQTGLSFSVTPRDFARLACIPRGRRMKLRIRRRRGLRFLLKRYKGRAGFFLGVLFFAVFLSVSGSMVWTINVTGCSEDIVPLVETVLDRSGVRVGVMKASIDTYAVSDSIVTGVEGLAWAAVNIRGTTVDVEVREKIPVPYIPDEDSPCNIIASESGVITAIRVYSGVPEVKVGDAVSKGDLLISGIADSAAAGMRLVRARGEVQAMTAHTVTCTAPLRYTRREYTGDKTTRRILKTDYFSWNISLSDNIPYSDYGIIKESRPLTFFGITLPVRVETYSYLEIWEMPVSLSEDQAFAMSAKAAQDYLDGLTECLLLKASRRQYSTDSACVTEVRYTCIEDICREIAIGID